MQLNPLTAIEFTSSFQLFACLVYRFFSISHWNDFAIRIQLLLIKVMHKVTVSIVKAFNSTQNQ